MRSLGIDVGVAKGLDAVLLDDHRAVLRTDRHIGLDQLPALIRETTPEVVAIDSPPGWARPGEHSRSTERLLRAAGILSFNTPSEDRGADNVFYTWMRIGFGTFEVARQLGYPRYRTGPVQGTAIEVFPHATAVALAGYLGPSRSARRAWRRRILIEAGVDATRFVGPDQVDAALAALTGVIALEECFYAPGAPDEGVIVVPVRSFRSPRYVREAS